MKRLSFVATKQSPEFGIKCRRQRINPEKNKACSRIAIKQQACVGFGLSIRNADKSRVSKINLQ